MDRLPKTPPRIALIACQVLQGEIEKYAAGANHIAVSQYHEIGLHDRPDQLRATLQSSIDAADAREDIDAIVLVYGLCGKGAAGLRAGRHPLVIPRAHDCITLFFGSREKYASSQAACPDCYYYTPGWNRARRVPGPDRLEAMRQTLAGRFDEEDIAYLLETEKAQWAARGKAIYLELQTPDALEEAAYAKRCAGYLGWEYHHVPGDPKLLNDLLWGEWDEDRYLVVGAGKCIAHVVDASVLRAE